jgi:large subunit ribosomal protein L15
MAFSLHSLAPKTGSRTKKFRIGRGHGSGRGKTAGRGTKGQRSRTGGRNKLKLKGLKQMLLSFPKNRGFQSRFAKPRAIKLSQLNRFENGTVVDLKALRDKGLLTRTDTGAKLVTGGTLEKKLTVSGIALTSGAKVALEKAGGAVKA